MIPKIQPSTDAEWRKFYEDKCREQRKEIAALQGCDHKFIFLRTAKWIESTGGYNTQFVRVDTFFCEKCLKQEEKRQEDYKRDTPSWYRD